MKKLNIEFKPLIISALLIGFQSLCYFIAKLFENNIHLIGGSIDSLIPFNIWTIIPYSIWYFMLFIIPYYIYKKDKDYFCKYILNYALIVICASIIFIIYPTTVNRPIISGNNILELLTRLIFYLDTPVLNCFPSVHCAVSMSYILFIFKTQKTSSQSKILTTIISISIMAATLFIKQHVFIDLISGNILSIIIFIIVIKDKKLTKKIKELLKIK